MYCDVSKHPKCKQINHSIQHWGKEVFYRVLLASLLPKVERILALDTDVIINGDITDIYNTSLENAYFGADQLQTGWFNVGMLMSAFRKYGISIKILWNKSAIPFIKPSSKLSFYLINFYGTFIVMFLYAFTKKTPIGKYIYNNAYTLLKKVIINMFS